MIPNDLKLRALKIAQAMGISFGQLIRESLEMTLHRKVPSDAEDVLFRDHTYFEGDAPSDLSKNHDQYLYGDKS